jgi:hypothetical protein
MMLMDANDSPILLPDRPTVLGFDELYRWVMWQFPRRKGNGLVGAVHPPQTESGWYPAEIKGEQQRVLVYGHLKQRFDTPEVAADWLYKDEG